MLTVWQSKFSFPIYQSAVQCTTFQKCKDQRPKARWSNGTCLSPLSSCPSPFSGTRSVSGGSGSTTGSLDLTRNIWPRWLACRLRWVRRYFSDLFAIEVIEVCSWISFQKHCQRHNGPEGWVHLAKVTSWGHITSSNTNHIPFYLQNLD